jgi:hypothetical protein
MKYQQFERRYFPRALEERKMRELMCEPRRYGTWLAQELVRRIQGGRERCTLTRFALP